MKDVLYATGCFEIGDVFFDAEENPHVITDVMVCHYIRSGAFKVLYEVDNRGKCEELQPVPAEARPGKSQGKSPLQLIKTDVGSQFDGSE